MMFRRAMAERVASCRAAGLVAIGCCALLTAAQLGCGTTRWTDTARTATEQLVLSDAIERAVSQLDLSALAGKDIFFDMQYLAGVADQAYLSSTLRQHLLANGCVLKEKREDATYVVEARAGAVGTDRHDMLFGMPSVNLPTFAPGSPMVLPSSVPEIALMKKTQQAGFAKIALFAYNRQTGRPIWQSGVDPVMSTAKATWVFGAGPFQQGTIHEGTRFAGGQLALPMVTDEGAAVSDERHPALDVTTEARFPEEEDLELARRADEPDPHQPASFETPSARPLPGASDHAPAGG